MQVHLEEPKLQTMLVTIGAFRHPKHRTSKPYDSSLLRRGSAGYPNKKAKKKKYIYIEIARDLFSLPIMLRALSCFFFSFSPAFPRHNRLQNSPYFCVFRYGRAVEQKVWNEAENIERDWGETLRACEARALCARKTLTPRFTDFFTDFEKKTDCFAV